MVEAYADRKRWLVRTRRSVDIPDVENRHQAFFARRRMLYLVGANPAWANEAGWPTLFARIDAEHANALGFLNTKRGTRAAPGPLGGGADPQSPAHLDLQDVAKVKTTTPAAKARQRAARYLRLRRQRVAAIVWRACAVHNDLWGATPALNTTALSQLLDHRLRVVERMNFTVASAASLVDRADPREELRFAHGNNPSGPWRDGFRIRSFEYPRLPKSMASVIGAANILDWNQSPQAGKLWQWETPRHRRLHYRDQTGQSIRFPPTTLNDWTTSGYLRRLIGAPAGTALQRLFVPRENWWERHWLFCDHVVAALMLEGLQFALRRRHGGDATFDALQNRHAPSYMGISGTLNTLANDDNDILISDGPGTDDPFFEKTRIQEDDIQVGDHLIIWNSFLYASIARGEWQLENSIVIDVDVNPLDGQLNRRSLRLQGHGIGAKRYSDYLDEIAAQTRAHLDEIREAIRANPAGPTLIWNDHPVRLVRWDPYEPFPDPGAWWIRLGVPDDSTRRFWIAEQQALDMLRKAVPRETAPGPGYHDPPVAGSAVFFPVFEPFLPDRANGGKNLGWPEYFRRRRAGPLARVPRLIDVRIEGDIMPGLFFYGQSTPIPLNRYRVKP
jgi:hypothetical protein